jgi:hypothetical protein
MWVYDGEDWTHDDGSFEPSAPKKPETPRQQWPAELVPELQVIEIVQPVTRPTRDIPFPLP